MSSDLYDIHTSREVARRVRVTYAEQVYQTAFPFSRSRDPIELSALGMEALTHSAREIARETAKAHENYIVDAVLRRKAFKE